jgi:UPF0755 protein
MISFFRCFVIFALLCLVFLQALVFRAPSDFPHETFLIIENGATLKSTANDFENRGLVRSAFFLRLLVTLRRGDGGAVAGDYFFKQPASLLRIAERLSTGEYGLEQVKITIPEGANNREAAEIFSSVLPKFSKRDFLSLALKKEGYLFPDTYSFFFNATSSQVIKIMEENFKKKTIVLEPLVTIFGKPIKDAVVMSSLLEKEVRTTETRRIVSGILWKRLRLGMPLQVDAVFPYIFAGKAYDLRDGDLMVDSPYNTYKYKGLPPGAISNPGLDSLRAAVTPIDTPYLYYLSDKEGEMHYSKTHDEHLKNRAKYLNL